MPTSSGLQLVLEKCPCRFHKQILQPDRVVTMSVHFIWAGGAKTPVAPTSCGFLVHLHALVANRDHFMPKALEKGRAVTARWVLNGTSSGQVLMPGGGSVVAHLRNSTECDKQRTAAGANEADHFSLC